MRREFHKKGGISMRKLLKMVGVTALLGALIMAGGCGGGGGGEGTPVVTNPSVAAPVAATVNPDGTATTGTNVTTVAAPPGTSGYLATVSATLPPDTTITAKNADGTTQVLTAAPSLTFTAPADSSTTGSGIDGVPVPTGFVAVASTSGAVDVQLTGAASATFDPPITITMPVSNAQVGTVIDVWSVTGTTYTFLGNFPVTAGTTGSVVSFPISSLSWKVCHPVFTTPTGSTGSPGGSI
jgi:hypothetical protein